MCPTIHKVLNKSFEQNAAGVLGDLLCPIRGVCGRCGGIAAEKAPASRGEKPSMVSNVARVRGEFQLGGDKTHKSLRIKGYCN